MVIAATIPTTVAVATIPVIAITVHDSSVTKKCYSHGLKKKPKQLCCYSQRVINNAREWMAKGGKGEGNLRVGEGGGRGRTRNQKRMKTADLTKIPSHNWRCCSPSVMPVEPAETVMIGASQKTNFVTHFSPVLWTKRWRTYKAKWIKRKGKKKKAKNHSHLKLSKQLSGIPMIIGHAGISFLSIYLFFLTGILVQCHFCFSNFSRKIQLI